MGRNRTGRARRGRAALAAGVTVLALALFPAARAAAQSGGHGMMHGHGAGGMGHDEVTMPGLRGLNATPEESAEMQLMFRKFRTLAREVENLPDGIRTVTRSSDPEVMAALVSHVVGMIGRVEAKDDPQVFIQSPTLDMFFVHGDRLVNDIQVTDAGIVVTQTTDDPEMATLLQIHAAEVSDMAARGMEAVHERMMGGN